MTLFTRARSHLHRTTQHSLQTIRRTPLSELSGALGDLGTFLPLFLSLAAAHSIDPGATLVFSGAANVVAGAVFGLPVPVQPMKAIAAAALDAHYPLQQTVAAGLWVSGAVFVLAVSGALEWFGRVVPVPVVRGIQLGAGLQLMGSAGGKLLAGLGWMWPTVSDNLIWAIVAFLFLVVAVSLEENRAIRIPTALILTVMGIGLAVLAGLRHGDHISWPLIWIPRLYKYHWHHFQDAIPAAIGQLPLTILNSILATSSLSSQLLSSGELTPSLSALGISLSVANLISAPFGGMPICHGSGGLAAQWRFGARSGASVILLGILKLLLGLFAIGPVIWIINRFPYSILGIMVIAAGIELARTAEGLNLNAHDLRDATSSNFRSVGDEERKQRFIIMLVTVAGVLAFKNDAVGFLAGLIWHIGLNYKNIWSSRGTFSFRWRRGRSSEIQPLLH